MIWNYPNKESFETANTFDHIIYLLKCTSDQESLNCSQIFMKRRLERWLRTNVMKHLRWELTIYNTISFFSFHCSLKNFFFFFLLWKKITINIYFSWKKVLKRFFTDRKKNGSEGKETEWFVNVKVTNHFKLHLQTITKKRN